MAGETIIGATNGCGCCEGIAAETPGAIFNRPGLSTIAYRAGTHQQFKATLLTRLHSSRQLALRDLRTRDDDDFTIALFDALATVADILTFYTERIANEAYLRTAVERRSVLELAQLIGYQLRPGVAASTWLAFTIDDTPGAFGTALGAPIISQIQPEPAPTVVIDIGTKVQSVPGPGEKPQVYETVEKINARAEWNAIRPIQAQPQSASLDAGSYLLQGAVTTLKAGDQILVLDGAGAGKVKTVVNVTVVTDTSTLVSTTQIDVDSGNGFVPSSFTPPSPPPGSIDDFAAGTPLTASVVSTIVGLRWEAAELIALAKIQKWPLDQLSADINRQISQSAPPGGGVFAFRQRASVFGYNAPVWFSLPPNLRFDSFFRAASGSIRVKAAFPDNWEKFTVENRAAPSSDQRTVFLDVTYPGVLPQSWIALHSPVGPGHTVIARVLSNTDVAHSDFSISGRVSELVIQEAAPLTAFPLRKTAVLCQSEALPLAPAPIPDLVEGDTFVLDRAYLELTTGQTVILSGVRSDLEGVTVAEVHTLQEVTLSGGFTVIKLDSQLTWTYKRSTVFINANVALASNGETVRPTEILGSGDATQAFQSFPLRQPPLTWIGADTPSGTRSTLQIRVNGILWKEVPYFFSHGPEEHIYVTRQDDAGNTTVITGDGKTGARLPTGTQNITANYRKGIGIGGLVRANQLSQMMQRPLGVRGANNPLAATGASDPESLEDARRNATLTILTLDRVVSLEDYQDFARAFAGIAKAAATFSWNGEQRIVLLTVAGIEGATVPGGSKLYQNLYNAIQAFAEPNVTLGLYSYQPIFFRIGGAVAVDPTFLLSDVQTAVETALRTAFSFDARDFGQPVHRSEVIAAIQNVPGVVEVNLTQFYRSGQASPTLEDDLPSAMPRSGADALFGAQLLALDPRPLDLEMTQ